MRVLSVTLVAVATLAILTVRPARAARPIVYVSTGTSVDVIDLSSMQTIASIPLTAGVNSGGVAASPDGRHVYVADGTRIAVIDVPAYSVSYLDLEVPRGLSLQGLSPDGRRLYIGLPPNNPIVPGSSIAAIDSTTNKVLSTIYETQDDDTILAFLPDSSRFYASAYTVAAMDSVTGKSFAGLEFGTAAAVTPDGRWLYLVHNYDSPVFCDSSLTMADTATNRIVRRDDLGKDICPRRIVISPDGSRAYLSGVASTYLTGGDLNIHVLDLKTRQPVATIPVYASTMAISDDGRTLVAPYVVIDTAQNQRIGEYGSTIAGFALAPMKPELAPSPLLDAASLPRAVRGSIVSLFGSALARGTREAASIPLPTSLLDTVVTVDGIAAPLLYVSSNQINLQIPWEVSSGPVSLQVKRTGLAGESRTIPIENIGPGIFVDASGRAAVLHSDTGELVTRDNPARFDEILTISASGLGPVNQPAVSGSVPAHVVETDAPVVVMVGGAYAEVAFAGLSTQAPGVYEVRVRLGKTTPVGSEVPLALAVSGIWSNWSNFAVQDTRR